MTSERPVSLAIECVERLNRQDFTGLAEIMSPEHRLLPGGRIVLLGRTAACESLSRYVSSWPEFQIHISDGHLFGNTVASSRERQAHVSSCPVARRSVTGGSMWPT